MNVERLVLGDLDTNCWLVSDGRGGPLLVVDPAGEAESLLDAVAGRPVEAIVLTHGHFDHLAAATALRAATGAPLLVHEADAAALTSSVTTGAALFGYEAFTDPAERTLAEGDSVEAGATAFRVLHTPGHTPGCICLYGAGHLFSGDTLFAGSVGRTDFAGGDAAAMRRSIARLAELPDDTLVHPGHGPDTTIARERRMNPFFPRA